MQAHWERHQGHPAPPRPASPEVKGSLDHSPFCFPPPPLSTCSCLHHMRPSCLSELFSPCVIDQSFSHRSILPHFHKIDTRPRLWAMAEGSPSPPWTAECQPLEPSFSPHFSASASSSPAAHLPPLRFPPRLSSCQPATLGGSQTAPWQAPPLRTRPGRRPHRRPLSFSSGLGSTAPCAWRRGARVGGGGGGESRGKTVGPWLGARGHLSFLTTPFLALTRFFFPSSSSSKFTTPCGSKAARGSASSRTRPSKSPQHPHGSCRCSRKPPPH